MNDTNEPQSGNFMDRLREAPRTVSAIIIILIVAAAIYAFSGNPKQEQAPAGTTTDNGAVATMEPTTSEQPTQATPSATAGRPVATPLPEARKTDTGFVEVAQKGEGVTKLARRAAAQYLADNKRPAYLPITIVREGAANNFFELAFDKNSVARELSI